MGYFEERQRIIDLVTDDGQIIELTPNRSNLKKYYKEVELLDNYKKIAIRYPGYKTTKEKYDYCVCLVDSRGEHPISHVEIMNDLYHKTTEKNYYNIRRYVEDVARYGKDIDANEYSYIPFDIGFNFQELTGLMFYIAIQEDINYPESYYQGRKMCFSRYVEAIYCKLNSNYSLQEAIRRATERRIPKNWEHVGDLYDNISKISR